MAYSSTLSTRMRNCSAVSCSTVLLGDFLDIGCDLYDSNLPSDLVPPAQAQFLQRKAACSHPTCLNPISVSTALWALPSIAFPCGSLPLPLPLLLSSGRRFRF